MLPVAARHTIEKFAASQVLIVRATCANHNISTDLWILIAITGRYDYRHRFPSELLTSITTPR